MAKIIRKPSALKSDYLRIKKAVNKTMFSAFICILTAVLNSIIMQNDSFFKFGLILTALSVIVFLICIVIIISKQNELAIKKQGVLGEDNAADVLCRRLSDDYTVFQNCVITLDGKSSEIDFIVVGGNGIFVVEAKNRNGTIEGNYKKDRWIQHKVGYKGGSYSAEFYSPVKQVSTHIFRLAGFLRQNGIPSHIDGAVYFSNKDAHLKISGTKENIPVFNQEKDLIRFINKNDNAIHPDIIKKICEILK